MLSQGINIWGGEQFAPLFGSLKRYFQTLQASLSQHYTMSLSTITSGSVFEVSFSYLNSGTSRYVLDGSGAVRPYVFILGVSNVLNWNPSVFGSTAVLDGVTITNNLVIPSITDLHTLTLTTIAESQVSHIGSRFNASEFMSGIIGNLTIDQGTITHDFAFDTDLSNTTIVNKGTIGATGNITTQNLFPADAELYEFDGSVSPNTWTGEVTMNVIEVAGT